MRRVGGNQGASGVAGWLCVVMAASVLLTTAGSARAVGEIYGPVTVTPLAPAAGESTHGYVAYRFSVANVSTDKSYKVTVALPEQQYGMGMISRISRSGVVGPRSTVVITLFQPPLRINGSDATVWIDGRKQKAPVGVNMIDHADYVGTGWGGSSSQPLVLLSRDSRSLRGFGSRTQYATHQFDAEGWSANWLAYSRFDGVVVSSDEIAAMTPGARLALIRYVECGGVLMVRGEWQPPESWGSGRIVLDGKLYVGGFGQCVVMSRDADPRSTLESGTFASAVTKAFHPWREVYTPEEAHDALPILEGARMPVRLTLLALLAFCLLIGPANVIWLARRNRRIWLWWTVPAMSLAMCAMVFGLSVLSEGLGGRYRAYTVTILDQESQRATSIGMMGLYSGTTPSGGLHFSYDTELSPQEQSHGFDRSAGGRTIDWTDDQHLASGWMRARTPVYFKLRKSESRRERLVVESIADGTISVVNGLGADIERLTVCDEQGYLYFGEGIPAGAKATLGRSTYRISSDKPKRNLRELPSRGSTWRTGVFRAAGDGKSAVVAGDYLAVLADNPFVEMPLKSARRQESLTLVIGRVGGSTDGN